MDVKERVHKCLILEEMGKHGKAACRLGLKDRSRILRKNRRHIEAGGGREQSKERSRI
ncbi:MAG: hypothetical protein K6F35_01545 [Lachnospiraceae bacterium]|nr:hypothetical protein [Lachnospiraceae bacterium]